MRKLLLPTIMAGTLLLGGCAAGLGNPIGGILGSVLGGSQGTQGNGSDQFQRAAVNACGQEAARYGRVSITNVQQRTRDTVRVDGRIETNDRRERRFTCTFRSDGRIIDFRTS